MRTKKPMPADMGRRKMTKEEVKLNVASHYKPEPRGCSKREYERRGRQFIKEMRAMTPDERSEIYRIASTL